MCSLGHKQSVFVESDKCDRTRRGSGSLPTATNKIKRRWLFLSIIINLRVIEIYSNILTMWARPSPRYYYKQITGFINHIIFMLVKNPFTVEPANIFLAGWTVVATALSLPSIALGVTTSFFMEFFNEN